MEQLGPSGCSQAGLIGLLLVIGIHYRNYRYRNSLRYPLPSLLNIIINRDNLHLDLRAYQI